LRDPGFPPLGSNVEKFDMDTPKNCDLVMKWRFLDNSMCCNCIERVGCLQYRGEEHEKISYDLDNYEKNNLNFGEVIIGIFKTREINIYV
jgi:hypothetical protein